MSRHVVVTGASSGIGRACATAFAALGDRLSLGARRQDRLHGIAENAYTSALDVTEPASVESFVTAAIATHGPIDVLVNNAGLARGVEKIAEGTGEAWREMIETNVLGLLEVTRRVLPGMIEQRRGHVIVIGSIAGHVAYPGGGVYCGSKRALQPICEAIRMETLGTERARHERRSGHGRHRVLGRSLPRRRGPGQEGLRGHQAPGHGQRCRRVRHCSPPHRPAHVNLDNDPGDADRPGQRRTSCTAPEL